MNWIFSLLSWAVTFFLNRKKAEGVELGEKTQQVVDANAVIAEQKREISSAQKPVYDSEVIEALKKGDA